MPRTSSSPPPQCAAEPRHDWPDADVWDTADVAQWMLRFEQALKRHLPGTLAELQRAPTLEAQVAAVTTPRPRGARAFSLADADDHALGILIVKPPHGSLGRRGKALPAVDLAQHDLTAGQQRPE